MELRFRINRPPVADVTVTLQVIEEHEELICGLRYLEGWIKLPPRAMRAAIIKEIRTIERIAKEAGCAEMRHCGDDRGWFLPDYEPMPELPNGRRKRL